MHHVILSEAKNLLVAIIDSSRREASLRVTYHHFLGAVSTLITADSSFG